MSKDKGFEITEKDIEATLRYLKTNVDENATREDAVQFLEEHKSLAHLAAHKIVEDENTENVEPDPNLCPTRKAGDTEVSVHRLYWR